MEVVYIGGSNPAGGSAKPEHRSSWHNTYGTASVVFMSVILTAGSGGCPDRTSSSDGINTRGTTSIQGRENENRTGRFQHISIPLEMYIVFYNTAIMLHLVAVGAVHTYVECSTYICRTKTWVQLRTCMSCGWGGSTWNKNSQTGRNWNNSLLLKFNLTIRDAWRESKLSGRNSWWAMVTLMNLQTKQTKSTYRLRRSEDKDVMIRCFTLEISLCRRIDKVASSWYCSSAAASRHECACDKLWCLSY